MENEIHKFECIAQKLVPNGKLQRVWELRGGISAKMTVIEIMYRDGQTKKMIVRQHGERALRRNPHTARDEFRLLQTVQFLGLSTQIPYYFDESNELFSTPYLVISYLEGDAEFSPSNIFDYVVDLAINLAKIHQTDYSNVNLSFLPCLHKELDVNFDICPLESDELFDTSLIRSILKSVWPIRPINVPTLLHGDFWPGNVLCQNNRLIAVIDWEEAKTGDPLMDFAISRLEVLWIFGVNGLDVFSSHYHSVMAIDYSALPYWDLYAALRIIYLTRANLASWANFFPQVRRYDITEHTMIEGLQLFITQALDHLLKRL